MVDRDRPVTVSLDGEIVEIIENDAVFSLRLVLHHLSVFDLVTQSANDLHLGDRIAIDGELRVDAVRLTVDREARRQP